MKKLLSVLLTLVMVITLSVSVTAAKTEQEHVHDEFCEESATVVTDEDGNVLSPDSYHFKSSRLFPCCKDMRFDNLTAVILYQHLLYGTTCEMKSQPASMCNACGYICPDTSTWKAAGNHSIVTQKGKNGCPF